MKLTKEQLSKLSKEEKVKLLELIQEKKRRDFERKPKYEPHDGQLRAHLSQADERYVFSGNGWGKSAFLVNEMHAAASGFNPWKNENTPVPAKICLLLDSPEKIEDILTEYRRWNLLPPDWCHKRGRHAINHIEYPNGSTITVLTHDVNPLKLEGSQWDVILCDEPPPKHVFTSLFRGGRIKGRKLKTLLCGTPITAAWLRTSVYEPWSKGELPGVECFRGATEDNKQNLAEGYIERFKRLLSEKEQAVRLRGEFFDLSGMALAHLLDRNVHVLKRDKYQFNMEFPTVVAIDPHPSKAHFAILMGADEYGPVYIKEMSLKATPREFARALKQFYQGFRVIDIVCDNFGSAESTGGEGFLSFIQVLREEGVMVRPTRWDEKNDEEWINRLQDALAIPEAPDNFGRRVPKLRFMEGGCRGVLSNIENVQWTRIRHSDEVKPTLDITNQDWLACTKYALATNLTLKKTHAKPYYVAKQAYGFSPERFNPRRKTLRLKVR